MIKDRKDNMNKRANENIGFLLFGLCMGIVFMSILDFIFIGFNLLFVFGIIIGMIFGMMLLFNFIIKEKSNE